MIDQATFEGLRPYLFAIAYRMLGTASEAEDVIQDAWLRASYQSDRPDSARAWLTTVVTRLALDRLKSARATREVYVGPWLPEPVATGSIDNSEDAVVRRESITIAFLVLLESLSASERAAFLLREVFDYDYRAHRGRKAPFRVGPGGPGPDRRRVSPCRRHGGPLPDGSFACR